jgi:hypothetical protein
VPYVLMGTLTLGAGLGVGLNLSGGRLTVNSADVSDSQSIRCTTSVTHLGRIRASVSCSSSKNKVSIDGGQSVTVFFQSVTSIPKGFAACLQATLPQNEPIPFPAGSATTTLKDLKRGVLPKPPSAAALKKYAQSSQVRSQQKAFRSALIACGLPKDKP